MSQFLQALGPIASPLYGAGQGVSSLLGNNKSASVPKIRDPYAAPKGFREFSTLNRGQGNLLDQIFAALSGQGNGMPTGLEFLQELSQGGPEAFSKFEEPLMRQFNEQTIPQLAEQFAGLGAGSSSGFQQALGQAGAGLSENLASLRSGLQLQSSNQLFQNLMQLLGLNTRGFVPKEKSFLKQLGISAGQGIGQGIGQAGSAALFA